MILSKYYSSESRAASREKSRITIFQLIRYFFVGLAATAVDYGSYYALTRTFALDAQLANPPAYIIGSLVSFLGQRTITFRSHGHPGYQYLKFLIVNIIGLGVSQLTLVAALDLGVHDLLAKVAAVAVSGGCNYLGNRLWTFRPTGGRP